MHIYNSMNLKQEFQYSIKLQLFDNQIIFTVNYYVAVAALL